MLIAPHVRESITMPLCTRLGCPVIAPGQSPRSHPLPRGVHETAASMTPEGLGAPWWGVF